MTLQVLQRALWHGQAAKQGDTFRMAKDEHRAVCELWSHQFGWELKLLVDGELRRSQVCREQDIVFATFEGWREAMNEKGWA